MKISLRILLLVGAFFLSVPAHAATGRVALVIGNGAYAHAVALPNPANDAADVASLLRELDFEVVEGSDLTRQGMERTIREFAIASSDAKVVLFFYAGHGMQVAGRNYLIPTDARLLDRTALDFEAIDVEQVFGYMTGSDKIALAFLDACRNNPLAADLARALGPTRSIGRGLAPTSTAGSGLFIAFATAPNDVARDGDGRNSPFTTALLRHLPTPGVEIQQVMTRVKADVQDATDGQQRPWHNSDLSAEVFLAPHETVAIAPIPADETTADTVFWQAVEETKDADSLRLFLEKFPNSRFADEARRELAALSESVVRPDAPTSLPDQATRRCRLLTEALRGKIADVGNRRIEPREIVDACEAAVNENRKSGENWYNLALAYNNVDNYAEYERALVKAAKFEHVDALQALGGGSSSRWSDIAYDPQRGERALLRAAELGSVWAAYSLSSFYGEYADPSFKDMEKSRYWYDRHVDALKAKAESGDPDMLYSLGQAYMWGQGPRIPADPQSARELLEDAEEKGSLWALGMLVTWYTRNENGFVADTARAIGYRRKYEAYLLALYERGYNHALVSVAGLYQYHDPIKDTPKAVSLYKEAASQGIVSAYSSLSSLYGSSDNKQYYDPREELKWDLKYAVAKNSCGMSPEDLTQELHPDIPMLATPERAARCVLDSVGRDLAMIFYFPGMSNDWMTIHRPTRLEIQRILKQEGFYSGAIDGIFGQGTFNALEAYQEAGS